MAPQETSEGGAQAPPFSVIVCGSGYTLHDDLAAARAIDATAPVIGVNRTSMILDGLDHFFTFHPEQVVSYRWLSSLREKSPGAIIHGSLPLRCDKQKERMERYPFVDRWHVGLFMNGTSTWGAVRLARRLGFTRILLCGMPLMDAPHADGGIAPAFASRHNLRTIREAIANDTDHHAGIVAFSGWPARYFGGMGFDHPWSPERSG